DAEEGLACSALRRALRRDFLREAVLRWITPFWAVRSRTLHATRKAPSASFTSEWMSLSSNSLRPSFRVRLRHRLRARCWRFWRMRFFAEGELAIAKPAPGGRSDTTG